MSVRVAINGFGRIGRLVFRQMMGIEGVDVVALNDVAPLDNLVYLLRHDSVYVAPGEKIAASGNELTWNESRIAFTAIRNPEELPWSTHSVDVVIEASGVFTKREDAAKHLAAGAKKVIITAPAKGADVTLCMGVNEHDYDPNRHSVVSNASCTTNCLAPVAKVLDEEFGIVSGFLTTVHALTSSQSVVDSPSKKWRRGRAAGVSIIPTTTGAATATALVLPNLKGKMDGFALRVPIASGSVVDFVVSTEKPASIQSVNEAFRKAAESKRLKGILGITDEEIVSADIIGMTYSALVDAKSTGVVNERLVKVIAWYDNEWGYARRVVDLAKYISMG